MVSISHLRNDSRQEEEEDDGKTHGAPHLRHGRPRPAATRPRDKRRSAAESAGHRRFSLPRDARPRRWGQLFVAGGGPRAAVPARPFPTARPERGRGRRGLEDFVKLGRRTPRALPAAAPGRRRRWPAAVPRRRLPVSLQRVTALLGVRARSPVPGRR